MEERPNYYAILPANVRYDNTLKDKAKLLYGEIVALSNKEGYCWATNTYFAELYKVNKNTISRLIQNLIDKGYIETEIKYKEGTKEIEGRYIKICIYPYQQNGIYPIYQKLKDNNTSINNININIKENNKRKVFNKPTIEEIENYCKERNNFVNPNAFYDFYESKDWMVGKNKMKDWKAAIRTWETRTQKTITKIIPKWFNENIESEESKPDEDFKNFIEEFRNE